jgi:hypothetical protein
MRGDGKLANKMHNITVRFTEDQLERLRNVAQKNARPVANMITWVVLRYLDQDQEAKGFSVISCKE